MGTEASGLSVTLKQESRDGMWMVFHGSPSNVRQDILETFGLTEDTYTDYVLHDLALEAQRLFRGMGNASSILGAKSVSGEDVHDEVARAKAAADAKQAASEEESPLLKLVEACESVADLQALYKRNADAFKADAKVLSAWKAKGQTLSGAK